MVKEERMIVLLNMRWDILTLHLLILAAEEHSYQGLGNITHSTIKETYL